MKKKKPKLSLKESVVDLKKVKGDEMKKTLIEFLLYIAITCICVSTSLYAGIANVKNRFIDPAPGSADNQLEIGGTMNSISGSTVNFGGSVGFVGGTITGASKFDYEVASDSVTLNTASGSIILCTKAGAMSVTLPTAVGNGGLYYLIKKTGSAGVITIDTFSTQTIDGVDGNTEADAQYDFLGIVSDGSNWHIIARYIQ